MRKDVERVHQIIGERLAQYAEAPFRESLQAVFQDRLASEDKGIPWLMLPILTCEALGGEVEPAYHVAAGLEMGRIAAGCLDEWQDHDTEDALWQAIGPERTVSLATGMIALSFLTVGELGELGVDPALGQAVQREFALTLWHMSAGQYADLGDDLSLDRYEAVAGAKTATILQLGCRAGALFAGASPEVVGCYGELGYSLGLLIQVWNDLFGWVGHEGKNDAEQQRGLPILAALALGGGSDGGLAGRLYTVLQMGFLYQRASEALARCLAPGRLPRVLQQFDPARLAEMIKMPETQGEGDREHQSV